MRRARAYQLLHVAPCTCVTYWVVGGILWAWLYLILPDRSAHVKLPAATEFLVKTREGGDHVKETYKRMTSLDGFEINPAVRVCGRQASDFDFDTRLTLPDELRDLSHVVDRVALAKRAWDTSYNELREATMTWIRRKRTPCSFSDDSCQPVDFIQHDDELNCHLHYVRAQALAIATNIVMQTVNGLYPATSEGADEKKRGSTLSLLMLTKSAPWNFRRRENARETWLALAQSNLDGKKLHFRGNKPCHWRLARKKDFVWSHRFVLGLALDRADGSNVTEVVFKEQRHYRDILLYPGVEDTAKTSWKVMWELAFVTRHQMFEHLLLLEDDSFVRFDLVAQYLSANHHDNSVLYSGYLSSAYHDTPKQGRSKQLPSNSVPALSFVNGAGTFLSKRVVHQLLVQARSVNRKEWDPKDDEFIGKLCLKAGVHPQNLPTVHLRPDDGDRVELFDYGSSDEDIEFTMISKHLPREMFNRMTSGTGSLIFCPGIRLKRISERNIPKCDENARDGEVSPEVHMTQTRTVKGSLPGLIEKVQHSKNLRTEQFRPDPSQYWSFSELLLLSFFFCILRNILLFWGMV